MASARAVELKIEVKNLRALKLRFTDIAKSVSAEHSASLQRVGKAIQDAYRAAAIAVRDDARSRAATGGAPRRLYSGQRPAIFAFSDFDAARDNKRSRSSLVGVRTGLSSRAPDKNLFVRWGEGSRRAKDNSIAEGGLSMSLGALFERGTRDKRVKPRRYFRSAIFATRGAVVRILTNAYRAAADAINRA